MDVMLKSYQFLSEDRESAFKEIICAAERELEMRLDLSTGNYKSAKVAAEDVIRSLSVLEHLQKKKRNHDKLQEVLEQLRTQGVTVDILQSFSQ